MGEKEKWYVVRVPYARELKLKDYLDQEQIECFVPMRYKEVEKAGRKKRVLASAVSSMAFIHSSKEEILKHQPFTAAISPFAFMIDKACKSPMVVPDREMRNFMLVANHVEDDIVYLDEAAANMKVGEKVKVIGGPFEGVEGIITRIKKHKRILIRIEGVAAVATTHIPPEFLQKVE